MRYVDRTEAGRHLAAHVADAVASLMAGVGSEPVVLGVPRGGVIVAAPVARMLGVDLDVALARKIGAPHNEELAIGAVGEVGEPILADDLIRRLEVPDEYVASATQRARAELARRAASYRSTAAPPQLDGRIVIVVDDGIATGATLRATLQAIRGQTPAELICAVPVGPRDSVDMIAAEVDAMVCPLQPRWFRAVGEWYESFAQTSDREVIAALAGF